MDTIKIKNQILSTIDEENKHINDLTKKATFMSRRDFEATSQRSIRKIRKAKERIISFENIENMLS